MKAKIYALLSAAAMLILILDAKAALTGASAGVELCIRTLIPSLFPFFVVCNVLTASVLCFPSGWLKPLEGLLRIPKGTGSIFLVGLLGGYPLGAQALETAREKGSVSESTCRRMLGFCSNAGPAFLFGVGATLFPGRRICWILWAVHILSAVLNGILIPGSCEAIQHQRQQPAVCLPAALKKAVSSMGLICGWVVLFRVLLQFLERWFLWLLPDAVRYTVSGVFELANGCIALGGIKSLGLRFTLCSVLLAFGGLCVTLQTASVSQNLGLYLPGKFQQACIAYLLSLPCQLLFPKDIRYFPGWIPPLLCICYCLGFVAFCKFRRNSSSIPEPAVV